MRLMVCRGSSIQGDVSSKAHVKALHAKVAAMEERVSHLTRSGRRHSSVVSFSSTHSSIARGSQSR